MLETFENEVYKFLIYPDRFVIYIKQDNKYINFAKGGSENLLIEAIKKLEEIRK